MGSTHDKRRVLLAGASGYIGRHVAMTLVRRGYEVIAVLRPGGEAESSAGSLESALSGCELRVAPVTDADALTGALADMRFDAVISCLASRSGAPDDAWAVDYVANHNLLAAAQYVGASRFVLLSAICVQRPKLAFQHAKLAFEQELRASNIDHGIVRPTAFFKSLAGQIDRVRAGKPFLVFGDGVSTACKPIAESDLADYLVDVLEDPAMRNRVLPIGGPGDAITPREQGEMLCRLAGQPVRIRRVSPRVFDLAVGVLAPLSRVLPGLAAKAEFARIGRYYATESMLLWNEQIGAYDADATPSYGEQTLSDFYARVLREGAAGQELGAHKLF